MIRIETVEIIHATCERRACGHEWSTRGTVPKVCPKCKSRLWHKSMVVERDGLQAVELPNEKPPLGAFPSMPEFHIGPRVVRGRAPE